MTITSSLVVLASTAVVAFGITLLFRRAMSGVPEFEKGPWTSTLSYVATAYGVVLGFSIVFLFGEFSDARNAVGREAAAIRTAFDEAQLFGDDAAAIQHSIICYARSVSDHDWPALQGGNPSPVVDEAFRDLFSTLGAATTPVDGTFQPAAATNLVLQMSNISAARATRVVAAGIETPPLLWGLLLFGGALVLSLLFVVTLPAPRFAQAALVSMAAVFTVVMLLIVVALGSPFREGSGRLSADLIEETTTSMEADAPEVAALACASEND